MYSQEDFCVDFLIMLHDVCKNGYAFNKAYQTYYNKYAVFR